MKDVTQIVLLISFGLAVQNSFAGSATWNVNPSTGDWNTAANWTPATVPDGFADIATFAVSNKTNISVSSGTEVYSIVFTSAASVFTISPNINGGLNLSQDGILNNSGVVQTFDIPTDASNAQAFINFFNNATAGSNTLFTVSGTTTGLNGGSVNFYNESTADHASFVLSPGLTVGGTSAGGQVTFSSNATS